MFFYSQLLTTNYEKYYVLIFRLKYYIYSYYINFYYFDVLLIFLFYLSYFLFFFFFFFQAEDGIRDADVTGVQTCALPIFVWRVIDQGAPGNATLPSRI